MPQPPIHLDEFSALVEVVEALRGPAGCPWDKEQTHYTLTQYAIEEAHELAEAIESGQTAAIVEELGDLLLQVVLHAEVARQAHSFTLPDVIRSINTKMIRRHPHVFGQVKVEDSREVLQNWSKIKEQEKGTQVHSPTSFSIPPSLPALQRASKIGDKTRKYKFDWDSPSEVMAKIQEELEELQLAMNSGGTEEIQHELGDLFFSLAQLARHLGLDSEQSLRTANSRFERRFFTMLQLCGLSQEDFTQLSPEAKEAFWTRAKINLEQAHK